MGKDETLAVETKIRGTGWFSNISLVISQFIGAEIVEGHTFFGDDLVLDQVPRSLLDGDLNVSRN